MEEKEYPKYRLNFEIDAFFRIPEDIEMKMFDESKMVLNRSDAKNKGSIEFELNTLDRKAAEVVGKERLERFINCLLVVANLNSLGSTGLSGQPVLVNEDKFKGERITGYAEVGLAATVVRPFEKVIAETTNAIVGKIDRLKEPEGKIVQRCLFWLRRGAGAVGEERFFYRWIALECLSRIQTEDFGSTQKFISSLLNNYLETASAKEIYARNEATINSLIEAELIGWKGAKRSENLKDSVERRPTDYKGILIKTALCLFEVRNLLLHKGEVASLIGGSDSLLRDLTNRTLIDYLQRQGKR